MAQLNLTAQGTVRVDDGARLSYQLFGPRDAPAVVLANGIGIDYHGLGLQIEALQRRYRVICWDYRGTGDSLLPDIEADLSMPRHAEDILGVLDALAIPEALFVGWSMGVQVALEVARRSLDRLVGLVALLGSDGLPFHEAFPASVAAALEWGFGLLARHPLATQLALDTAVRIPSLAFRLLNAVLFVGSDADREVFAQSVRSVARTDKRIYLRTMLALAQHDGGDMLPRLTCPTLVISGSRDRLTPTAIARRIAGQIPRATHREVPGGTHFALMEQPELVNGWLLGFAAEVLG